MKYLFYILQKDLAKKIWQTTADLFKARQQEEILRKRIYLRRLPSRFDQTIDQSLNFIQPTLMNNVIDNDRRASLKSNYSKTITQYKFDLMTLNLDTIQNVIRGHQKILSELEAKLYEACYPLMIQAIENRRKTMIERHETYLKHKLNTFFGEAPMTLNE